VRRVQGERDRLKYVGLQVVTLIGAALGAKVAVLAGDHGWPVHHMTWTEMLWSGRSITGALVGGFLAAELAKPLFRYTLPPNDVFAAKLPFSVALGRVGCVLAGCCRGLPHEGWLALRGTDGVPRWPVQIWEVAFHLACGVAAVVCVRRKLLEGRVFAAYLVAYGLYRIATEAVRDTPKPLGPFSVYQAICLLMIACGIVGLVRRTAPARSFVTVEASG
jgi:phosphatidylglycerol:prolipoprotein diacylglycerol transferase